jgi:hypothetical protein
VEEALNAAIDIPQSWKSPVRQTFTTRDESLGLWFRDDPATQPGTKGIPMPVAPDFLATIGTVDHVAGQGRSNPSPGPWSSLLLLEFYPRRTLEFVVDLSVPGTNPRTRAPLKVRNPSPRPDAGWRAEPFPVRIGEADSPVQLHDLRVTGSARTRTNGDRFARVQTEVDWSFVDPNATRRLVAAQLRDPGGNRLALRPSVTPTHSSTNSLCAFGSLFFDEPVWQLDLFSTDAATNAPTAEIVTVGPVDIFGLPILRGTPIGQPIRSAEARAIRTGGRIEISVQTQWSGGRGQHELSFSLEGMLPGHWAELTSVTDDLGRPWSPAFPIGILDAQQPTHASTLLTGPDSPNPPPRRFTATFTFRPTQSHSVRVTPRFIPGNLSPTDLAWPLRPRD